MMVLKRRQMRNKEISEETYKELLNKSVEITINSCEIYRGVLILNSSLQITLNVLKPAEGISTERSTAYTVHLAKKGITSIKKAK